MIIPIKCVTCGMVLADKYRYFKDKVTQEKILSGDLQDEKYLPCVHLNAGGYLAAVKIHLLRSSYASAPWSAHS